MSSTYHISKADSRRYEEGYGIFLRRSDFREKVLERFEEIARSKFVNSQKMKVVDIGCGDGHMTRRYLEKIKYQGSNIDLTLIDPATDTLNRAKELLKDKCNSITSLSKFPTGHEFDFIIASYVFYHLQTTTLEKLVNAISPKGRMAIMMGTSENPLKSHPKLKELTNHGSSDKLSPFINSLNPEKFMIERFKINTSLDLQGLWKAQRFTEEAKTYLSFAMNIDFENIPPQGTEAISAIFQNAFENGTASLTSVHEIIWIERLE